MTRPTRHIQGFTLIELLVVVAIIALLISILLPSLTQARNVARMVRCEANLKQIGNAHQMYANEYGDYFVPHRLRTSVTLPWYRNMAFRRMLSMTPGSGIPEGMRCPNALEDRAHRWAHNYGGNGHRVNNRPDRTPQWEDLPAHEGDYYRNRTTTGSGNALRHHRGKIVRPSEVLQTVDASDWNANRGGSRYDQRWDLFPEMNGSAHAVWGGGKWNQTSFRHNEGANMLMFDGHAEHRAKTDTWRYKADGSTEWNPINRLWEAYRKR